jgi:hypothetical protein
MLFADNRGAVATVAVESRADLEDRPHAVAWRPTSVLCGLSPARRDIEPSELHSELAFVCPEVRERARQLLPERDPDAFLIRRRRPLPEVAEEARPSLPIAVVGYTIWRLLEAARTGFVAVVAVVALALLVDVLH